MLKKGSHFLCCNPWSAKSIITSKTRWCHILYINTLRGKKYMTEPPYAKGLYSVRHYARYIFISTNVLQFWPSETRCNLPGMAPRTPGGVCTLVLESLTHYILVLSKKNFHARKIFPCAARLNIEASRCCVSTQCSIQDPQKYFSNENQEVPQAFTNFRNVEQRLDKAT